MLSWNVYFDDFTRGKIVVRDVFNLSSSFLKGCYCNYKENKNNRDAFIERLRKDVMYSYWSKCEYEIVLQHWPPLRDPDGTKVDIYDQVMLNWDRFCDYVWENRHELKDRSEK